MSEGNEGTVRWEDFMRDLQPLCESKAEEFHLLGYKEVSAQDVWDCAQNMSKGQIALHEMVAAILGLNIGKFMNYMTLSAYKGRFSDDLFDAGKSS